MKYIEHIIEPEKLLLSWQPSDPSDRGRAIVAELHRNGDDADLVYLRETSEFIRAKNKGFEEYPGLPDIDNKNYSSVLSVFMRRLPPHHRKDFDKFLEAIRIRPQTGISDFALLGYAGGRLPGDDFTIIHPFDRAEPPFELLLLVTGYRYYQQKNPYDKIQVGMSARFEIEPENQYDPNAVRILIPEDSTDTAGYVCRGLLPQFRKWMESGFKLNATVERKNGATDQPLIYLFVEVRA